MKTIAEFHKEMHDGAKKEIQIKRKKRLIFRIVLVAGAIMGIARLLQQAGTVSDAIAQTLYIVLVLIIIIGLLLPRNIFKVTGVEIQAVFIENLPPSVLGWLTNLMPM